MEIYVILSQVWCFLYIIGNICKLSLFSGNSILQRRTFFMSKKIFITPFTSKTRSCVLSFSSKNKQNSSQHHIDITISIMPGVISVSYIKQCHFWIRVWRFIWHCKTYARRLWPVHTWLFEGSFCVLILRTSVNRKIMSWNIFFLIQFSKTKVCYTYYALWTYYTDYRSEQLLATKVSCPSPLSLSMTSLKS